MEPFSRFVLEKNKKVNLNSCHVTVTDIGIEHNQVTHISGIILEPSDVERGEKSSRTVIDTFQYEVDELLITSGGWCQHATYSKILA